jgi:hypothetical protein
MATDVFYPVAGNNSPVDGHVRRLSPLSAGETLSTIRAGSGTTPDSTSSSLAVELRTSSVSSTDQFSNLNRGIICFDTSSLGEVIIDSATISLYCNFKGTGLGTDNIHIAGATIASTDTLVSADYAQVQTISFSNLSISSITTSIYNDFSLDSNGIANINLFSVSQFSIQLGWDITNNFTGSWGSDTATSLQFRTADLGTLAQTPKLTVVHRPLPTIQGIQSIQGISSIQF